MPLEKFISSIQRVESSALLLIVNIFNQNYSYFSGIIWIQTKKERKKEKMCEGTSFNYRYRVKLTTIGDIVEFFKITTHLPYAVVLRDSANYCISAKSILGAIPCVNWDEVYCESEGDIRTEIEKFCI